MLRITISCPLTLMRRSESRALAQHLFCVRSLVEVLNNADSKTLDLLDELASGTDPGEGIGLSIAVLERLYDLKQVKVTPY